MRIANRKVAEVCKGSNDGTTSLPKGVDFGRTNPRQIRRTKPIAIIALFTIISVGCQLGKHNGGGGGGGNNAQLVSITVTPPSPSVVVGEQLAFSGYGTLSDGSQVSGAATWASSSTAVATINPTSGFATAVQAGTTTISATYQGITGQTVLTVTAVSNLAITTSSLPQGTAGAAYPSTQLKASGGTAPYNWTPVSLPNGLNLSSGGAVSGTPSGAGTFTASVQVSDSAVPPNTATANLSITIAPGSGVYACGNGSGNEQILNGKYAFLLSGFDDAGHAEVLGGSFTADGAGNITGGEEDSNNWASGPLHSVISATGSSYTLGADNRGCLVLSSGKPVTFSFALSSSNGGKGHIIEFDDSTGSGTRMAGIVRLQDPTSFSLTQLQPNYAFGMHGWDASKNPFAAAGSFSSNNNGVVSNGFADLNDGGTVTAGLTGISGTISSLSTASGRGSMTYSPGGTALDFAIYMVNANEFVLVGADPITSAPIISGQAIATTNSFSSTSLSGPYMFGLTGYSATAAGGDVTIGTISFDTVSIAQGNISEDRAGAFTNNPVSGTYFVDTTSGRVTLTNIGNHPPVVYLTNPTDGISGFVVGTDASASSGVGESQSGGPFSANSLSGTYILGTMSPSDSVTPNYVGLLTFTSGIATGTEDVSKSGANGLQTGQTISQTYSINTDGTGTGGPSTAVVTNGSTIFFVDVTPGRDPEIVVIEQ